MAGSFTPEERDAIGAALDRQFSPGPQHFRKRPVEIEAFHLYENTATAVIDWVLGHGGTARYVGAGETHPLRYETEYVADQPFQTVREDAPAFVVIATLEGPHRANFSDWIARGVKGEFYPIRRDIFEQTYEPVVLAESAVPPQTAAVTVLRTDISVRAETVSTGSAGNLTDHVTGWVASLDGRLSTGQRVEVSATANSADAALARLTERIEGEGWRIVRFHKTWPFS